jgi:hypothetical protein
LHKVCFPEPDPIQLRSNFAQHGLVERKALGRGKDGAGVARQERGGRGGGREGDEGMDEEGGKKEKEESEEMWWRWWHGCTCGGGGGRVLAFASCVEFNLHHRSIMFFGAPCI